MAETEESCIICQRLKEAIEKGDSNLLQELAESLYVFHLLREHGLTDLEILQRTGVYVH